MPNSIPEIYHFAYAMAIMASVGIIGTVLLSIILMPKVEEKPYLVYIDLDIGTVLFNKYWTSKEAKRIVDILKRLGLSAEMKVKE